MLQKHSLVECKTASSLFRTLWPKLSLSLQENHELWVKVTRFQQWPRPRSLRWRYCWSTPKCETWALRLWASPHQTVRGWVFFPSWNPQRLNPSFELHSQSQSLLNCWGHHWVQRKLISLGESCLCHLARVAQQAFSKPVALIQGIHVPNHHKNGWTRFPLATSHSSDISQLGQWISHLSCKVKQRWGNFSERKCLESHKEALSGVAHVIQRESRVQGPSCQELALEPAVLEHKVFRKPIWPG